MPDTVNTKARNNGGIDYATFEVNASGELTVSYLGGDYDNAFNINNNGELEVTV